MKHIAFIPTLLLALLLASCTHKDILHRETPPLINGANTHVSTRIAIALSNSETLTVNTIRVIIFTEDGDYITHGLYHVDSDHHIIARVGNYIIIDRTTLGSNYDRFSIPTVSGISHVYVILNEESGGLTNALNGVTTMPALRGLLSLPIAYTELIAASGEEPAFTMYIRGTFEVEEARPFDNPQVLDFSALDPDYNDGSNVVRLIRPMSRVTIERVTSHLMQTQIDANVTRSPEEMEEVSRIFILDMGLRNVPNQFWLAPNTTVPSWREFSFNNQNPELHALFHHTPPNPPTPYFLRDWGDGKVTIEITGTVRVRQVARFTEGEGRIWFTGNGNREISDYKYDLDRNMRGEGTWRNGEQIRGGFNNGAILVRMTSNPIPRIETGNLSNGPMIAAFNAIAAAASDNWNPETFELPDHEFVEGVQHATPKVVPGDWTLQARNLSFYIPENLTSSATELYIKATRASIPERVTGFEIFDGIPVDWGPWIFTQTAGQALQITDKAQLAPNANPNFAGAMLCVHIPDLSDPTVTQVITRYYWDVRGLVYRYGTITATPENPITLSADFQVMLDDAANAQTFTISIANDDGMTFRNREYRFSVHATHPLPDNGGTRSANNKVPFELQRVE